MKTYLVPILLISILVISLIALAFDKLHTKDVHLLINKEIQKISVIPNDPQVKLYINAVNEVAIHASRCLTYSNTETGICKDSHALDLVRALKVSDSVFYKTKAFKNSPFHFFEEEVGPRIGIQDINCRLENKKPICQVIRG